MAITLIIDGKVHKKIKSQYAPSEGDFVEIVHPSDRKGSYEVDYVTHIVDETHPLGIVETRVFLNKVDTEPTKEAV